MQGVILKLHVTYGGLVPRPFLGSTDITLPTHFISTDTVLAIKVWIAKATTAELKETVDPGRVNILNIIEYD